jgi:hypothetical protein
MGQSSRTWMFLSISPKPVAMAAFIVWGVLVCREVGMVVMEDSYYDALKNAMAWSAGSHFSSVQIIELLFFIALKSSRDSIAFISVSSITYYVTLSRISSSLELNITRVLSLDSVCIREYVDYECHLKEKAYRITS